METKQEERPYLKLDHVEDIICSIEEEFNQEFMPKKLHPYECKGKFSFYDASKEYKYTLIFWECGGVILIDHLMYYFGEDDGHWFLIDSDTQAPSLDINWIPRLVEFFQYVYNYVKENGESWNWGYHNENTNYKLPVK